MFYEQPGATRVSKNANQTQPANSAMICREGRNLTTGAA
jgi:hypothetical protein